MLRQTAPPDSMITNSESSHLRFRPDAMYDPNDEGKKAPVGQIMPKKQRARVLMDQKAASVADVAFVLGLQDEVDPSKSKPLLVPGSNTVKVPKRVLKNMKKRRDVFERLHRHEEEQQAASQEPRVPFSDGAKVRIAYEQNGVINENGGVTVPSSDETSIGHPEAVQVLWADLRDAAYAESWPARVYHGELEQKAVFRLGEDGPQVWSSVHVHGNLRDREAEAKWKRAQQEEADAIAAQRDAEEREARLYSRKETGQALPAIEGLPGLGGIARVEPPPKSFASRLTDTLMFWRR